MSFRSSSAKEHSLTIPINTSNYDDWPELMREAETFVLEHVTRTCSDSVDKGSPPLTLPTRDPAPTITGRTKPLRRFTLFPRLPKELREYIFLLSVDPFKSKASIWGNLTEDAKRRTVASQRWRHTDAGNFASMPLYQICHESRELALTYYGIPSPQRMPFNPFRDSVTVRGDTWNRDGSDEQFPGYGADTGGGVFDVFVFKTVCLGRAMTAAQKSWASITDDSHEGSSSDSEDKGDFSGVHYELWDAPTTDITSEDRVDPSQCATGQVVPPLALNPFRLLAGLLGDELQEETEEMSQQKASNIVHGLEMLDRFNLLGPKKGDRPFFKLETFRVTVARVDVGGNRWI
ncbi:hypothetical protein B0H66DRAFT_526542 [Apodospora peruviana]|uniref:2EXR domain-containing protein n=1 Tax=Apodospora peruviana TaxID=516989 RepID=A0AAE0IRD7_9PEZI|nr:hypothetical protein B0H66DRAFT_526542 [Apodospora peruviana]